MIHTLCQPSSLKGLTHLCFSLSVDIYLYFCSSPHLSFALFTSIFLHSSSCFFIWTVFLGCTVAEFVALLPWSMKVDFRPGVFFAWSLHVLPMHAWVLSGNSGFLPQSKDLRCVNECVHGCLCVALQWTDDLSRVFPTSCP
ncbi:hypothetical protein XENOCAPTIV_018993 [Xenoophorus captivus]|uniref:Uncharacterized protein n=1 Tax=Xenoophorus captivus TaxID=1517983 RepID=A0ABV0SHT1_9TELE